MVSNGRCILSPYQIVCYRDQQQQKEVVVQQQDAVGGGVGGLPLTVKDNLPIVRTPSKTLERPLGLVFLVYRGEY